ncbi:MAG: efflux RND transporter periplasmic adaptor subunit [Candidatus Wildermuthbacteria bacterium]|nr:efflux RND transporter periplasmic adaptor subunit [Candidatus Wildermuthbacteria bacterium]
MFLKKPIGIIALLVVTGIGIGLFVLLKGNNAQTEDFTVAERKNIVQEVTVTGNVKPTERVELAFEKTGTVNRILVQVGQRVKAGELLAQLDTRDAQQQVRNAQVELEAAKVALQKINLEYTQLLRGDTLNENYEDGLAILANLYSEYQDMLDDLYDVLFGSNLSGGGENNIQYYANAIKDSAVVLRLERLYRSAKVSYAQSLLSYQSAQRGSGEERQNAIQSGYDLAVHTAEIIKVGRDTIRSFEEKILTDTTVHSKQTIIDDHIATLNAHSVTINTYVTDLFAVVSAVNTEQDTRENYPLTVASQELTVRQKEIALEEAEENLAKYSIRAPMAAVLAKQDIRIGETISANTPVIIIISESEYEIEANVPEADIAKIRVGNPALISLDAYGRDEVFQASVIKIDPAEIIIEGVPTYKITLQFTQTDSRVKSGMTANINIRSAEKENVIAIPQRALIRENGKKFVRVLRDGTSERVQVETGLQGSDGNIEIVSGLKEGDKVIVFLQENR